MSGFYYLFHPIIILFWLAGGDSAVLYRIAVYAYITWCSPLSCGRSRGCPLRRGPAMSLSSRTSAAAAATVWRGRTCTPTTFGISRGAARASSCAGTLQGRLSLPLSCLAKEQGRESHGSILVGSATFLNPTVRPPGLLSCLARGGTQMKRVPCLQSARCGAPSTKAVRWSCRHDEPRPAGRR